MDEPINPNQNANQPINVSVPIGGVEGAPVNIEAPVKPPEAAVEVQPSETEPAISEDEKNVGVVTHPTEPIIRPDVAAVGVKPSIPVVAGYSNLPSDQVAATQVFEKGDSTQSNTWRALIAIKELARNLLGSKP
jgi:hypothetical protein